MTADPPDTATRRLASFAVASVPGNEREALDLVARSVAGQIPPARLDRLKTAVAEATANAIEHGHRGRPDLAVDIEVYREGEQVVVTIADQGPAVHGGNGDRPETVTGRTTVTGRRAVTGRRTVTGRRAVAGRRTRPRCPTWPGSWPASRSRGAGGCSSSGTWSMRWTW